MAKANFPLKLSEINDYFLMAIPWLNSHAARLQVKAARLSELNKLFDAPATGSGWQQVFPLTIDKTKATTSLRQDRDRLALAIFKTLRRIYSNLPGDDLTKTDRNKLRTFLPAKPGKRPPIETAPHVTLTAMAGGRLHQRLRVNEKSGRASRHPHADGWVRVSKIGGSAPLSPEECPTKEEGTRALSTIDAGMENDRQPYYCFVRWVVFGQPEKNGPWSSMKVMTISAGTVGGE